MAYDFVNMTDYLGNFFCVIPMCTFLSLFYLCVCLCVCVRVRERERELMNYDTIRNTLASRNE